jgi:hypothetical protein
MTSLLNTFRPANVRIALFVMMLVLFLIGAGAPSAVGV